MFDPLSSSLFAYDVINKEYSVIFKSDVKWGIPAILRVSGHDYNHVTFAENSN